MTNAYYPQMPDYTLYSGVHVCWSEHSDSSFVHGFMSLDYSLGTMTATTFFGRWHKMTHKGWHVVKPQHNNWDNSSLRKKELKCKKHIANPLGKHAYIILTPLNPTFI